MAVDSGHTHRVKPIEDVEKHCAGEYNETKCSGIPGRVGLFAQEINSELSHGIPLVQSETERPFSLKYNWFIKHKNTTTVVHHVYILHICVTGRYVSP